MNPLIKITEERERSMEVNFEHSETCRVQTKGDKDDCYCDLADIKSHITTTLLALVDAEIKRLEGMNKGKVPHLEEQRTMQDENILGYNQAINDQIEHLKEYRDYLSKR